MSKTSNQKVGYDKMHSSCLPSKKIVASSAPVIGFYRFRSCVLCLFCPCTKISLYIAAFPSAFLHSSVNGLELTGPFSNLVARNRSFAWARSSFVSSSLARYDVHSVDASYPESPLSPLSLVAFLRSGALGSAASQTLFFCLLACFLKLGQDIFHFHHMRPCR